MDPLGALMMAGLLSWLTVRTAGAAVTDSIASAKGKTPPSLEKWRARHGPAGSRYTSRAERPDAAEPGGWRRRWDNAVEAHTEKAAQKHQARMQHLRETEPGTVARHKDRLARRAARRDAVNARVAGWGRASWQRAKNTAAHAKTAHQDRKTEKQAWAENARRTADPAIDDTPTGPIPVIGPEPEVISQPNNTPDETTDIEPHHAQQEDNRMTTPTHISSPQGATCTEITDLDTAITYSEETARYTDTVASTLDDILAQIETASHGLDAEAGQYEQAAASLSGEGFTSKVTSRFTSAGEALQSASDALAQVREQMTAASEQVTGAGGEMRSAVQTFSDQQALQEQIGAAQQDAGVSRRTDFYAPA